MKLSNFNHMLLVFWATIWFRYHVRKRGEIERIPTLRKHWLFWNIEIGSYTTLLFILSEYLMIQNCCLTLFIILSLYIGSDTDQDPHPGSTLQNSRICQKHPDPQRKIWQKRVSLFLARLVKFKLFLKFMDFVLRCKLT